MIFRRVAVLCLLAVLVSACGAIPGAGWPEPDPGSRAAEPGALTVDTGPLGETFEEDVRLARTLSEQFWAERFAAAGRVYRPITAFVPYTGEDGPACAGRPALPENAFYCPAGHFIAFDAAWLREMWERMGDASVYVVIPHEFGHAVQAQLMTGFRLNIEAELQADCYAGATLGALVRSGRLQAEEGDEEELFANLEAAGDPTDAWWDPNAHGTGPQRQAAFVRGYDQGVESC